MLVRVLNKLSLTKHCEKFCADQHGKGISKLRRRVLRSLSGGADSICNDGSGINSKACSGNCELSDVLESKMGWFRSEALLPGRGLQAKD